MPEEIFVTRSSMPPFEEYVAEIRNLWETHWLTNMGAKHEAFREALCAYWKAGERGIDLFTNGHMALELSLQAMNRRRMLSCATGSRLCFVISSQMISRWTRGRSKR